MGLHGSQENAVFSSSSLSARTPTDTACTVPVPQSLRPSLVVQDASIDSSIATGYTV